MANLCFCMAETNTHCKAIILQLKTKNKSYPKIGLLFICSTHNY